MTPASREIKAFIVMSLREPLAAVGVDPQSVPDDFDLRASGVIDSLGFIQLLCRLEERFACAIDLADVPPEQLTNVGALSEHVSAQLGSSQLL